MKYLTIEEVCEMLSISRRTLERMRKPTSKSIKKIMDSCEHQTVMDLREEIELIKKPNRVYFLEPDFYIGESPRWEMDNLITWLKENGRNL